MKRLTERIRNQNCVKGCGSNCKYGFSYCKKEDWENCQTISDVIDKLADYEELEEQGRLVSLPCTVGDIVYVNGVLGCGEAERYRVIRVDYHSTSGTGRNEFYIEALLCTDPDNSIAFYDKQFGKTVFFTKSEAKAKLAELRGAEDD